MNLGAGNLYDAGSGSVFGSEAFKNSGSGSAAFGAVASGSSLGALSSSGSGNMVRCALDDTSFYCQLSKFVNILAMIIYIFIVVLLVSTFLYYVYTYVRSTQKRKK